MMCDKKKNRSSEWREAVLRLSCPDKTKRQVNLFAYEYSRFRYLEAFKKHSTHSYIRSLKHAAEKFTYAIECSKTDNGFEFTNEMGNIRKKPPTAF